MVKNTEQFIEKSNETHKNFYNYEKTVYEGYNKPVTITCPIHGDFLQKPTKHLSGHGCPECGRMKRADGKHLTKEEFVKRSFEKHGNLYDYSKSEIVNAIEKTIIICPVHGEFKQKPEAHMHGNGCPQCAREGKKCKVHSLETFIEEANKVHNNKYIYTKSVYNGRHGKTIITCPIHGDFEQEVGDHLHGSGCQKCAMESRGNKKRLGADKFKDKGNEIHNFKYIYDEVEYKTNRAPVKIICPEHGPFYQTPMEHLSGCGCPICSGTYMDLSVFKERSSKIHNNKYIYTNSVYCGARNLIEIICPIHGPFWQSAYAHSKGHGCPVCNESKGEENIARILSERKISYIRQKEFEWLVYKEPQRLDFYLPMWNVAIEFQGVDHFMPLKRSKNMTNEDANDKYKYCVDRDENKFRLCTEHGVKIYYINYFDDLDDELGKIITELQKTI